MIIEVCLPLRNSLCVEQEIMGEGMNLTQDLSPTEQWECKSA